MSLHSHSVFKPIALVLSTLACVTASMNVSAGPGDYLRTPEEAVEPSPAETADVVDALPLISEPGAVEVIQERYADGKVKIRREVTLDTQGNYVNHGPWKMWDQAGHLLAEGQYDMGKREGAWTRWHSRRDSKVLNEFPFNRFQTPFASQVNFTAGVMDGDWIISDAEQNRCQLISLKMGHRDGPAITWLPSGKIYRQWTYDNDVPVGEVLQISEAGELQRSQTYLEGRRVVKKTNQHGQKGRQKKSEEMFLAAKTVLDKPDDFWTLRLATFKSDGKDLRHGLSKSWYVNGTSQQQGEYEYGKKVGRFTYWYPNGQVALAAEYRDDRKHGLWVWWHENGQKSDYGAYEEGARIGIWRKWNDEGKLTQQKSFDGTEESEMAETSQPIETAERQPLLLPSPQRASLPQYVR